MVSLYSAHQHASNDVHVNPDVTLRSRDLRSTADLDLMIRLDTHRNMYMLTSAYAYFDAYQ